MIINEKGDIMEKINTGTISGFMELLPAEQILFDKMMAVIRKNYASFGFIPLDTPILERTEVLLAKAGGETEQQIYSFTKGKTNYSMRFDHTVPLARYVADKYGSLTFPFKRSAIGKVYRGERPQAGRFREFYQADIDIIGNEKLDLYFDAEIPSIIAQIFKDLGFNNFLIRVNNRKIFNGLFAGLNIQDSSVKIMQSIDKIEKIGFKAVKTEIEEIIESEKVEKIFNFLNLQDDNSDIISGLRNLGIRNEEFNSGVDELEKVVQLMVQLGVSQDNFTIDLTIARGLDYYTGTVFETQLSDYPDIGSVCSGGRYDNLASEYTNRKLPGVGISIGLSRLFDQLLKKNVITTKESTLTRVLVLLMSDDIKHGLELATKLRNDGISVEVSYNSTDSMKKRLGYADKLGIPYAVFVGDNEVKGGYYTLKNLETGEQEELSLKDFDL